MGSKERREREKLSTRQRILDAARELFVDCGYDDVTMRKIAERIEYSPTAIYVHFADKEALMTELSVCDFRAFTEAFSLVPTNGDAVETLHALGRALIQFAREFPHQYRLLFMTERPKVDPALKPGADAYTLLVGAVTSALAAGAIHPSWDPHVVAQTLWGSLHGLVALHLVMPPDGTIPMRPLDGLCETAMTLLLRGFGLDCGCVAIPDR